MNHYSMDNILVNWVSTEDSLLLKTQDKNNRHKLIQKKP